jgi:hypothetical protein
MPHIIIATVISILGFIVTLGGLYMAHQNKRLRNVFVYLTHIALALALMFLAISTHTEIASYEYTQIITLFFLLWVAICTILR